MRRLAVLVMVAVMVRGTAGRQLRGTDAHSVIGEALASLPHAAARYRRSASLRGLNMHDVHASHGGQTSSTHYSHLNTPLVRSCPTALAAPACCRTASGWLAQAVDTLHKGTLAMDFACAMKRSLYQRERSERACPSV